MAQPVTASWSKFIFLLESPAGSGTFVAPCGLTSKGLALTADTADSNIVDCDDPDAPTWTAREVRSLSGEFTGSGLLALGANGSALWRTWFTSGDSRNVRIKRDVPLANDGGHWAGLAKLTALTENGNEDDGKIGFDITVVSDGILTWVPASA